MTASEQLDGFLDKFSPEIAAQARAVLRKMRKWLPGATELVYDNYNALAIGFGPNERSSEAIFSVAVFPRWVSLFFLRGKGLSDPQKLLRGSGNQVRHIVLESAATLEDPGVQALMAQALEKAEVPLGEGLKRRLVVKSVSAKQRPRRPEPVEKRRRMLPGR